MADGSQPVGTASGGTTKWLRSGYLELGIVTAYLALGVLQESPAQACACGDDRGCVSANCSA